MEINLGGLADALTLDCPFHSQWDLRANELCSISNQYLCLYDANKMQNVEACRDRPQFDAPGKSYLYSCTWWYIHHELINKATLNC